MNIETRIKIERQIVRQIVKSAIEAGHVVSVYDGAETTVKCSDSIKTVMDAIQTTDEDRLAIWTDAIIGTERRRVGYVWLTYGNDGVDVISDHTDTEEMVALLQAANDTADRLALVHA